MSLTKEFVYKTKEDREKRLFQTAEELYTLTALIREADKKEKDVLERIKQKLLDYENQPNYTLFP